MLIVYKYNNETKYFYPNQSSSESVESQIQNNLPPNTDYLIITDEDLPIDRTFQEAFDIDFINEKIVHDIEKAKNIWRERIRLFRANKLKDLDIEFIIALEKEDEVLKNEVKQKKQWFRDLPSAPEIANATTVDELKSFWPDELN